MYQATTITASLLCLAASALGAPVNYTGGLYTQNFDGLARTPEGTTLTQTGRGPHDLSAGLPGSVGVDGWYGANPSGSSGNTEYRVQNGSLGSGAGRGVISFGQSGSSERALGALSTSNQINSFGAVLVNSTGFTITDLTISYTGEQWRRGNVSSPNTLGFFFGLGGSISSAVTAFNALNFVAPNTQAAPTEVALDGNAAQNRAVIGATISGLNWAPGASLAIAWKAEDLSGQDDGLAIDDVSIIGVPAPAGLPALGLAALGFRRRRD